jgi:hypothetical protein
MNKCTEDPIQRAESIKNNLVNILFEDIVGEVPAAKKCRKYGCNITASN